MTDAPLLPHVRKAVGARLKIIRLHFGLPQKKMTARYCLSSQHSWAHYEKGNLPLPYEIAVAIAKDCDIPLDWIYRGISYYLPAVYTDAFAKLEAEAADPKMQVTRQRSAESSAR